MFAHKTIKTIKTIKTREYARDDEPKPEPSSEQPLAEFTPDETHIALADRYGLDLDAELAKFRDSCIAKDAIPKHPAAAFRVWLRRGPELGLGNTPDRPASIPGHSVERRARKILESSTPIRSRMPDTAERTRWVPAVARMLSDGIPPAEVVQRILEAHTTQTLTTTA